MKPSRGREYALRWFSDLNSIELDPKYDYKLKINNINAPVYVGDIVGKLHLYKDGKKYKNFDITVKKSIKNKWIFNCKSKFNK